MKRFRSGGICQCGTFCQVVSKAHQLRDERTEHRRLKIPQALGHFSAQNYGYFRCKDMRSLLVSVVPFLTGLDGVLIRGTGLNMGLLIGQCLSGEHDGNRA